MWTKEMIKSQEKVEQDYLKKEKLTNEKLKKYKTKLRTQTLGEMLREDQRQLKHQRLELLLKILCVIITIGYLTWIMTN